jgi:hypothetical protein
MKTAIATYVVGVAALLSLAACASKPGDTIEEIEVVQSGDGEALSVETADGREWPMRAGLPCDIGDRLWGGDGRDSDREGCADENDLLVEQGNARDGDGEDFEHEGEQSSDSESDEG